MFSATKYNSTKGAFALPEESTKTTYGHRKFADVMYKINGGGRDTYIFNDNGGFNKMHGPRAQEKSGAFLPTVNRSPEPTKKYAHVDSMAKSIMYNTDGTGRDGYVTCGNGGFTNPNKIVAMDPRVVFKNSLRGYQPDGDYLRRRQNKRHNRMRSTNAATTLNEAMEAVHRYNKSHNAHDPHIARRDRNSVDILAKHRNTIEPKLDA